MRIGWRNIAQKHKLTIPSHPSRPIWIGDRIVSHLHRKNVLLRNQLKTRFVFCLFQEGRRKMSSEAVVEVEVEDWTDKFDFEVHYALSEGKFAFFFDSVTVDEEKATVKISNSELPIQIKDAGEGEFTKAEITQIAKFFEEEPAGLEGNVFCTKEKYAVDALKELKLAANLAEKGERRKTTNESITKLIVDGFAAVKTPAFEENLTPGEIYRFSIDIFNLENFDDVDPVTAAWVAEINTAVEKATEGKTKVTLLKHGDAFPEVSSNVKEARLLVSNENSGLYVYITPASNGWKFFPKN